MGIQGLEASTLIDLVGQGGQPPVTVTGVAPWAFKKEAPAPPETGSLGSLREEAPKSGLERVHTPGGLLFSFILRV